MPNSLKCRLKKLEHQGLLSEKDLSRIYTDNDVTEELEKIKAEINEFCKGYLCTPQPEAIADDINEHIINRKIAELKGENK